MTNQPTNQTTNQMTEHQLSWQIELLEELRPFARVDITELLWAFESFRDYGVCSFTPMIAGVMVRLGLLENKEKLAYLTKCTKDFLDLTKESENK